MNFIKHYYITLKFSLPRPIIFLRFNLLPIPSTPSLMSRSTMYSFSCAQSGNSTKQACLMASVLESSSWFLLQTPLKFEDIISSSEKILAASLPANFFLDLQPNIEVFSTTSVT